MLLAALFAGCSGSRRATILYVTDAHEIAPVVDAKGDRGGVARLKTVVDRLRQRSPGALLVFGGDLAGGSLFGGVFHGEPMVDALSRVGVGLASFGQHDFDFGDAHARRLVARSRFPWITSNLVDPGGAPFAGLPTRELCEVQGMRVGFIGLTAAMDTTMPGAAVVETDLVAAARKEADALRREGAEAIVALTQTNARENARLLREVPLLDAILTEEETEERTVVRRFAGRLTAAPAGNLGTVVELRLESVRGGRPRARVLSHAVDARVPPDPALSVLERDLTARLDEALAEPVARVRVRLRCASDGRSESPLGDLVADAFREAAGAQAALVPAGSVRADLPAGLARRREVTAALPFGNRVVLLELKGSALRAALADGVARGRPLQVSGLSYRVSRGRLAHVSAAGEPLRDDASYRVAMSSYLAAGGDGFGMLAGAPRLEIPGGEPLDADALAAHLARLGRDAPVRAPAVGRITLVRTEENT